MATREEIIAAIRKLGEGLGRAPSQAEFRKVAKISWHQVYKHFRGMRAAVRAAGFEPGPRGGPLDENALVLDWARVVRELGRLPSRAEYVERGKHHSGTLHARLGWSQMAHRFVLLAREFHLEQEWKDVVEVVCGKFPLLRRSIQQSALSIQPKEFTAKIAKGEDVAADLRKWPQTRQEQVSHESTRTNASQINAKHINVDQIYANPIKVNPGMRLGRIVAAALAVQILLAVARSAQPAALSVPTKAFTAEHAEGAEARDGEIEKTAAGERRTRASELLVYGAPLELAAMAHAPTNEAGVIFLFGALAAGLGFRVERLQTAFPDCEAKREIVPGKWERVRVEFEFESRNFKEHRHDPDGCDVIVCWRHNWADCPERIEVVEFSRVVEAL
jgi:hypothetical protein